LSFSVNRFIRDSGKSENCYWNLLTGDEALVFVWVSNLAPVVSRAIWGIYTRPLGTFNIPQRDNFEHLQP